MHSRLVVLLPVVWLWACSGPESSGRADLCAAGCDPNASCVTGAEGRRCVCGEGYEGDGAHCQDIDGCSGSRCFPGVTCTDLRAPNTGFTCGACPPGYLGNGIACADADGCGGNPCFEGVVCTDVPAPGTGRTCGACPAGYSGDGMTCTEMIDCSTDPALCGANAACLEVAGAKKCVCGEGYAGDGATCADVDGCAGAPCFPGVACTDVPAPGTGHTCGACPAGTSGDGVSCAEVDGCAASPCFAGVACTDVPAPGTGRTCGPCPSGYAGDGAVCTALADCSSGPEVCDARATCEDVGGGTLRCVCGEGWVGGGATCTDVDECAAGLDRCDANARCDNTEGAYSCTCNAGTVGDGSMCSALVTACSQCDASTRATCTWQGALSKYACLCKPGFVGSGLGVGSCVATGYSLGFEPAAATGYTGACVPLKLTKLQGATPRAFSGEPIAVSSNYGTDLFFSDAGCSTPVTSFAAPSSGTVATFWFKGSETGQRTVTATSQVLGRATGTLRLGSGPAVAVAFEDVPSEGTTTGCMKGWVTLLDGAGAPAVETRSVTVTLSGTGGVAFSGSSSTCLGATSTIELTVGEFASSPVSFYFKGTGGTPGNITLRAEDKAALLQAATQDVGLVVAAVAGIRFNPDSYWALEKPGSCHQATLEIVDVVGGLIATPAPLTVDLVSNDGKMTVYGGTNCFSGAVGQVTVPAGSSSLAVRYSISAYGSHQLTATSAAGTASYQAYIGDPCVSCTPRGGSSAMCGGCDSCCSHTCGVNGTCY